MTSRRKTVLVTDDNEDLLDIFAFVLGQEGCNVVTAADGAQAVEKASLSRPDLILMDLHMPVMDGYEATHKIKFMPQLSRVPVIAISAQCDGNWKRRALEAGCMECVSKPLDADKLHSIVERYIGNCETDSARLQ